jgi:kumamolisin
MLVAARVLAGSAAPQGRNTLPGHLVPALKGAAPLQAANTQQSLNLVISLQLSNPSGLQALIAAQNDAHSSLYHQYLTSEQFLSNFAPSQAKVNAVVSFLSSQGLKVQSVAANRLTIDATGTMAAAEHAFNVQIANYNYQGHVVYAPTSEPSVPASLAGTILNIAGLDNVSQPHHSSLLASGKSAAKKPGLGPNGGFTPSEIRTAYDMNPLIGLSDGTGQNIAIVELDGYIPNDVNTYLNNYSLGSPKYTNILVDGATNTPGVQGAEADLDLEVVSAVAPGATQRVYIGPNTFQGFIDVFNRIVSDNIAKVVSNSWGLCESAAGNSTMQAFHNVFSAGVAQGQAFFSSTGDAGAYDCGTTTLAVDYPGSDPNVVGVGGTSLFTTAGGVYSSETAWSCPGCTGPGLPLNGLGTGGGLSSFWAQPAYQTGPGISNQLTNGKRAVPDVSIDGDPQTGLSVYCTITASFCIGWDVFGGTSVSSQLWAGIAVDINGYLAASNQPTLGSASAALYHLFNTAQVFPAYHDITSGNNLFYPATANYDLASGIGTPDVWNLARDLSAGKPVALPHAINLITTPGVNPAPQVITLVNTGASTFNWNLTQTGSQGITPNQTSNSIASGLTQQITVSFNVGNSAQALSATLTINDNSAVAPPIIIPVTVVAANVSKTWYFAEGFTGGSFTEFLTLANPNTVSANVQVQYFLGTGQVVPQSVIVPANSRGTIRVNDIVPNQNVSVVVNSDQPIVAERPIYFTYTSIANHPIPGGSDVLGATSLSQQFDFGYLDTTSLHDTFLTILNQNTLDMNVTITYFAASTGTPTIIHHTVPAKSRGTVKVNNEGLPAGVYSALVTLDQPGLVERPMYLVDSTTHFTGSADVVGVTNPLTDWDFAEGFTASTFNERYILSNPSTTNTAHATVIFFLSSGSPVSVPVTLAPGAQQTVNANAALGSNNVNNSAHVNSDQPILAERFMSFDFRGTVPGETDVLGAGTPSNLFFFAEGFTGSGFNEFLTIENPDATNTATVQVTFLPADGSPAVVKFFTVAPSSRFTLDTSTITEVKGTSFSMVVESNVAIVAERPMYFTFPPNQTGGSDVIGYQP